VALGLPSLLPHVDVACHSVGDMALPCRSSWWVVGIMGSGINEAKVVTRWGCMGIVDDGGG